MKKLIITVGISGSGKSTWSHNMFKIDKNTRIVNRAKIRELLFGYTSESVVDYYMRNDIRQLEKEVTKYEDTLIDNFLADNKKVVVDATHLKREYLERFKYWNVPTELKVFDVDLEAAKINNKKRIRQIPDLIIERQYRQFKSLMDNLLKTPLSYTTTTLEQDTSLPPCVIFDIDGTLAHMGNDRSPYDWEKVWKDKVDTSTSYVHRCLEDYSRAIKACGASHLEAEQPPYIIICTGRDGSSTYLTETWLDKKKLRYDELYIRGVKDYRADWIIKEEMWREISKKYNIIGMFDDRQQVVRRARALKLKVFNVENNNF